MNNFKKVDLHNKTQKNTKNFFIKYFGNKHLEKKLFEFKKWLKKIFFYVLLYWSAFLLVFATLL